MTDVTVYGKLVGLNSQQLKKSITNDAVTVGDGSEITLVRNIFQPMNQQQFISA